MPTVRSQYTISGESRMSSGRSPCGIQYFRASEPMPDIPNSLTLKHRLLALCREYAEDRIRSAEEAIRMVQESANEETKSSSGDKYETGRAMAQLEIEKAGSQLAEGRRLVHTLERIELESLSLTVGMGSLVITNQGNYFLAIPAGKLDIDGITWFALSPSSPLGAALIGRHAGDTITFNGKSIVLTEVA